MADESAYGISATSTGAGSSAASPLSPMRILELGGAYVNSKILFTAVEFGVFDATGTDGATVAELAERCGLPERSARTLADSLAMLGLLERDADRFRNAPDAEAFLTDRGAADVRPLLRHFDRVSFPMWIDATTAFRTRQGVRGPLDAAQTEVYERGVAVTTARTAADLARVHDFGRHQRVLDVGGGYGTFLKPILAAHPHLTATLVDLPEVTRAVAAQTAAGPLAGRLTAVAADLRTDPLPGGQDAIIAANVLHHFSPSGVIGLLHRLREVVTADGELLLVDWWRTGTAPHPLSWFGAAEFLLFSGGDLYHVDEVTRWLGESGWRFVDLQELTPPSGVIRAEPA